MRPFAKRLTRPALPAVLLLLSALLLPAAALAQGTSFHFVVVPNRGSADVSVIDTDTQTEVARIPVGPDPSHAAASPDGQFAYVGESGFGAAPIVIDRINLATLAVEDTLSIPASSFLAELEVSPDGSWLVVAEAHMGTTYIVDAANWTVTATLVLCPICDGQVNASQSIPNVVFSADSSIAYAATNVNEVLSRIDLASGTVLDTRPAQTTFGGPYGDIERAPGERIVLSDASSDGSVRVFDIPAGTSQDLALRQGNVPDIALVPSGSSTLLASGCIVSGPDRDFLSVKDLQGGGERTISSSELLRYLRYNPSRNEVWATCMGAGACSPFGVEVFDMAKLKRTATVPGVSGANALGRQPAFSPDGAFFYQPMGNLDAVLVIDTATQQAVAQIPVGTNPSVAVAQGNAAPQELQ